MNVQLSPSLSLTTDSPASHYGIPVLRDSQGGGSDYGPADLIDVYHWGLQPAAYVICRLVKHKPEAIAAAKAFCAQWPDGPQPTGEP
jgi:hypothetical protein